MQGTTNADIQFRSTHGTKVLNIFLLVYCPGVQYFYNSVFFSKLINTSSFMQKQEIYKPCDLVIYGALGDLSNTKINYFLISP